MKRHLGHLAMCAPMLVFATILIVGGAGVLAVAVPVAGCILMMGMMMWMFGQGSHGRGGTIR